MCEIAFVLRCGYCLQSSHLVKDLHSLTKPSENRLPRQDAPSRRRRAYESERLET